MSIKKVKKGFKLDRIYWIFLVAMISLNVQRYKSMKMGSHWRPSNWYQKFDQKTNCPLKMNQAWVYRKILCMFISTLKGFSPVRRCLLQPWHNSPLMNNIISALRDLVPKRTKKCAVPGLFSKYWHKACLYIQQESARN